MYWKLRALRVVCIWSVRGQTHQWRLGKLVLCVFFQRSARVKNVSEIIVDLARKAFEKRSVTKLLESKKKGETEAKIHSSYRL